jgi:hypothetical protein
MDFPNIQRNDLIGQVKITALLGQTFLSDLWKRKFKKKFNYWIVSEIDIRSNSVPCDIQKCTARGDL